MFQVLTVTSGSGQGHRGTVPGTADAEKPSKAVLDPAAQGRAASWKGEEGLALGPSSPSYGAGGGGGSGAGTSTSGQISGQARSLVRSRVKGRLLGLSLQTKKTGDLPGSPLLPALPRRPGGPGQENKDRLVEKGSQQAWVQPTHPTTAPRDAACPPPCRLPPSLPSLSGHQSFTSHSHSQRLTPWNSTGRGVCC